MKQCWAAARAAKRRTGSLLLRVWSQARPHSETARSRESITVPCRSNGEIIVDVHHPRAASAHQETTPKILIYLPRGPFGHDDEQEASNLSQLSDHLSAHHVVRIKYRLNPEHQYPTPVHDTLAGFDWILENILPKRAISRPGRADHVGRIAVCGELIGGGIASMVALTECRVGQPGIMAAAVNNPLADWVSLDDSMGKLRCAESEPDPTVDKLLALRRNLFPKPDLYFDPLASPLLLFRTAGVEVPPVPFQVLLDDMAELSLHDREDYARQFPSNNINDSAKEGDLAELVTSSVKRRRTSRRFPSAALNLCLPNFLISSGAITPFAKQSEELAHLLRQSFVRQARQATAGSSFGRKVLLDDEQDAFEDESEKQVRERQEAEAKEKAQIRRHVDSGLWDGTSQGRERLREVATWVGENTE